MSALKDLFASEKGLVALILLVVVSAALFTGHTDFEGWQRFSMVIYGTYAVTKAGTSVAAIWKGSNSEPAPEVPAAPAQVVAGEIKIVSPTPEPPKAA